MEDPNKSHHHVSFAAELAGVAPVRVVDEEGDSDDDDDLVPEDRAAIKARAQREKYRNAIQRRHKELFAIQERLYAVRHDDQRAPADVQNEVRNLVRETVRLRTIIQTLYDREMKLLGEQLQLDQIGLPSSLDAAEFVPAVDLSHLAASGSVGDSDELDSLDSQRFMRTKSTQTLSDKPPQAKWQGMLKMFSEWRGQTALAQAQEATAHPPEKNTAEDIASIRAALHHLRMKKELTAKDRALQARLQTRLNQLTKGNR